MTQSNTIKQHQAQRILELFAIARQRYLDAAGNPRRTPTGLKGEFAIAVNMGLIAVIETCAATGVILGSPQKYK